MLHCLKGKTVAREENVVKVLLVILTGSVMYVEIIRGVFVVKEINAKMA